MNTKKINGIFCLFLMGGKSARLRMNKFNIKYSFFFYWKYCYNLLNNYFKTYLSLNYENKNFFYFKNYNFLVDIFGSSFGPISGILTSLKFNKSITWFVVSCDFVFLNKEIIDFFLSNRNPNFDANILLANNSIEPLFAIYEISSYKKMFDFFFNGYNCLKTFISKINTNYIKIDKKFLNINNAVDLEIYFSKQIIIKVLYFSFFKDYSLKDFEYFYFSSSFTLMELLVFIAKKYKILVDFNYLKFVVNNSMQNSNYNIKNKDVIFFLLPVSGG